MEVVVFDVVVGVVAYLYGVGPGAVVGLQLEPVEHTERVTTLVL